VIVNGQDSFKAGDITKFSNNFTVLNPDLVICNMDSSVTLEIELRLTKAVVTLQARKTKTLMLL
jgi:DNA-directed RNA polymerase subunit alpha